MELNYIVMEPGLPGAGPPEKEAEHWKLHGHRTGRQLCQSVRQTVFRRSLVKCWRSPGNESRKHLVACLPSVSSHPSAAPTICPVIVPGPSSLRVSPLPATGDPAQADQCTSASAHRRAYQGTQMASSNGVKNTLFLGGNTLPTPGLEPGTSCSTGRRSNQLSYVGNQT